MKMLNFNIYQSPLSDRYFDEEVSYIFSKKSRFKIWRSLWIALAIEQKNLGLNINQTQIDELIQNKDNINFSKAEEIEKKINHEVMSHILAYGEQCPNAKKIIHLGATSAYILDNTDLIQMKKALFLIKKKIVSIIKKLSSLAIELKSIKTIAYTHYQVAQPTTFGKRICTWIQDLIYDYTELDYKVKNMPFRGIKGATGNLASFLKLFNGDVEKVQLLDKNITKYMGFSKSIKITGQTYSRKIDYQILSLLSSISQSSFKFSNDIRLLSNLGEACEKFSKHQVGSSAMPYKKNPILSERISSLSRYVINLVENSAYNHGNQWLERTLDDSANKRVIIPEGFLFTKYILNLYDFIISNIQFKKHVIQKNYNHHFPFLLMEEILMHSVLKGGDRQELHEEIRKISTDAHTEIINGADSKILFDKIIKSNKIPISEEEIFTLSKNSNLVGIAEKQVDIFIKEDVQEILKKENLV